MVGSTLGHVAFSLGVFVAVGFLSVFVGVGYWNTPEPYPDTAGWTGPVSCDIQQSRIYRKRDEKCGTVYDGSGFSLVRRLTQSQQPTFNNCSLCELSVVCGATAEMPNVVDGTMEYAVNNRDSNWNSSLCMAQGESFQGWIRENNTEVQPARLVQQAKFSHQWKQVLAPFIVGTGSLAILSSMCYVFYAMLCTAAGTPSDTVSYNDCWGPNPAWHSQYAAVNEKVANKYDADGCGDCCVVCLSASAGEVQFIGCGHAVVCLTCAGLLRHCPVCDTKIDGISIHAGLLL